MTDEKDLLRRIELLETRMEIMRLISTFSHAVDLRDRDLLRSVWFTDSVLDLGSRGQCDGVEEILANFDAQWRAIPDMHHWFADPLIEVDLEAGAATDTVTVDVFLTDRESGPIQSAGLYTDRLERRDGRWAFVHRRLHIYYWTPIPGWVPTAGSEAPSSPVPSAVPSTTTGVRS